MGQDAVAMGWGSEAAGAASFAAGNRSNATGHASVALGWSTNASGRASLAMGHRSAASGDASTALGMGSGATTLAEVAVGACNVLSSAGPEEEGRESRDEVPRAGTLTAAANAVERWDPLSAVLRVGVGELAGAGEAGASGAGVTSGAGGAGGGAACSERRDALMVRKDGRVFVQGVGECAVIGRTGNTSGGEAATTSSDCHDGDDVASSWHFLKAKLNATVRAVAALMATQEETAAALESHRRRAAQATGAVLARWSMVAERLHAVNRTQIAASEAEGIRHAESQRQISDLRTAAEAATTEARRAAAAARGAQITANRAYQRDSRAQPPPWGMRLLGYNTSGPHDPSGQGSTGPGRPRGGADAEQEPSLPPNSTTQTQQHRVTSLTETLRAELRAELRAQLRAELRAEQELIRAELRTEIMVELREEMRAEVTREVQLLLQPQ